MFDVVNKIENSTIETVYAVKEGARANSAYFLMYDSKSGEWCWADAKYYMPLDVSDL